MSNNINDDQKKDIESLFEDLKDDHIEYEKIEEAEKKAGFLGEMMEDFLLLIEMIKDYWNGYFEIPTTDLVIIIATISYVAMPIDVMPDFIPFIGYIDDIVAVNICISKISETFERYKEYMGK